MCDAGFEYLEEKTELSERLTRNELVLGGVAIAVDLALYDYFKHLGNSNVAVIMNMRKLIIGAHVTVGLII